jgi:diguanylate cyclase (GGDEF)-like protein
MFRRLSYAVAGGVLSLGAPLGLAALRHIRPCPARCRASASLAEDAVVYAYVSLSTAIAFSLFGYVLGRRIERLTNLSETDSLTGLYNRRGLSQQMATELARWRRYRQPLAVVLVDLDGLKRINDRYGHTVGDAALRQVAAAIRAERREGDISARWGGDEFAILATNTPSQSALALAERLRHVISASRAPRPLTASFGIAALEGTDDRDQLNPAMLLQAADVALYDAKKRGGNAVAIARA